MEDVLIKLASITPVEVLAKKLIDSANIFLEASDDEDKKKEVTFMCSLWMSKELSERVGGAENMIKRYNKLRDIDDELS
jgi:hypothetical protein